MSTRNINCKSCIFTQNNGDLLEMIFFSPGYIIQHLSQSFSLWSLLDLVGWRGADKFQRDTSTGWIVYVFIQPIPEWGNLDSPSIFFTIRSNEYWPTALLVTSGACGVK